MLRRTWRIQIFEEIYQKQIIMSNDEDLTLELIVYMTTGRINKVRTLGGASEPAGVRDVCCMFVAIKDLLLTFNVEIIRKVEYMSSMDCD